MLVHGCPQRSCEHTMKASGPSSDTPANTKSSLSASGAPAHIGLRAATVSSQIPAARALTSAQDDAFEPTVGPIGVYNAAYFTKATCWNYERERRMVASTSELRGGSELLLLDAPSHCVRGIIVGSRATGETKAQLTRISKELKCRYFKMRIGKSSANPYFIDAAGNPHIFDGSHLVPAASHCEACLEPIPLKGSRVECSWYQIDDQMKQYAASRNSFRMLDRAGLLDSYIEGMDEITRRRPNS